MAEVRLSLTEAAGNLPPICVCCGGAATKLKTTMMSVWPVWPICLILVHPVVWVSVAVITAERAMIRLPFCIAHQHHWRNRQWVSWGTVGFSWIIFASIALNSFQQSGGLTDRVGFFLYAVGFFCVMLWLQARSIIRRNEIRAQVITAYEVVLNGIHESFIFALQELDAVRMRKLEALAQHDPVHESQPVVVRSTEIRADRDGQPKTNPIADAIEE